MGSSILDNIYKIVDILMLNDKTLIQLDLLSENCIKNIKIDNSEEYNIYKENDENLKDNSKIVKTYGIPIKYYNNNYKENLDLYITDFFWKFSYKTYLSGSIYNGQPSYDSIINSLIKHKVRGIHLDVYSNSDEIGKEEAIPVIRSDVLYDNFKALDFYNTLEIINNNCWKTKLPIIIYLTLNFNDDNIIYNKINYAITKIFKGKLLNNKYSFNGRNGLYSINKIKMNDALNKVIIITNKYPTNTKLDILINGSITNEISNITLDKYSKEMTEYGGITSKYSPTNFIENTKNNIFMFFSNNNSNTNTKLNSKNDLYNPDIIDCCKYGVQFTMMSLNYPDKNLYNWKKFFKDKSCILKNQSLRIIKEKTIQIKKKEIPKIPENLNTGFFIIN